MGDLSGCSDDCEWEANAYRLRGIETIPPTVLRFFRKFDSEWWKSGRGVWIQDFES